MLTQHNVSPTANVETVKPATLPCSKLLASTVSVAHCGDTPSRLSFDLDPIGKWFQDRPNGIHTTEQLSKGNCPTAKRATQDLIPVYMRCW